MIYDIIEKAKDKMEENALDALIKQADALQQAMEKAMILYRHTVAITHDVKPFTTVEELFEDVFTSALNSWIESDYDASLCSCGMLTCEFDTSSETLEVQFLFNLASVYIEVKE